MKIIKFNKYGGPEVLKLEEVSMPEPKEDEVLVKVHAASVNPLDWRFMTADPFFIRLIFGLFKPRKYTQLGADVSGTIEVVGKKVEQFAVGDEVFGEIIKSGLGAFGEYVTVKESLLVKKPNAISFEAAAALPVAGFTALQGVRNHGGIKEGDRVLINGASGGVGTYTVQLSKHFGAHVTGVCSSGNINLVKSIGADEVIDYTEQDVTMLNVKYDLVLDTIGNFDIKGYRALLKPTGKCIVIGFKSLSRMISVELMGGKRIKSMTAEVDVDDLTYLADLLSKGAINSIIDKTYSLPETPEAIRYLMTGRAKGKVIIRVE